MKFSVSKPQVSLRLALAAWGRCHPRRAILILSIISVVVSCYPVVFFGRSFVSANSVPMLYASIPTLPGHTEMETENFKGSDAGAIIVAKHSVFLRATPVDRSIR